MSVNLVGTVFAAADTRTSNNMRSRTLPLLIFAILCVALTPRYSRGQAGPPLLTDDPDTPGNGHWEINFAVTVLQTRDTRLLGLPLVDVNYGLGERLQLKAEVPWLVLQDRHGEPTQSGIGSTNIGLKWRFVDHGEHGLAISTYPQLEIRTSASSARRMLIEPGSELRLPIEMSRELGPVKIVGEFGYQIVQREKDEVIYGLAMVREVTKRLELLGELHGEATCDFNEKKLLFNLGGRFKLMKDSTLLFSAGRSFRTALPDHPTFAAYVGLQFHF